MNSSRIFDKAVSQSDQVELFSRKIVKTRAGWESNQPRTAENRSYTECALRVVKDGSLGFATGTSGCSEDHIVQAAISSTGSGLTAPAPFPDASEYQEIDVCSKKLLEMTPGEIKSIGEEALDMILSSTPNVAQNITVERCVEELNIKTSAGLDASYTRTTLIMMLEGKIIEGDNFIHFEEEVCRNNENLPWKQLVDRAIGLYKAGRKNIPFQSQSIPLLFPPQAFYAIMRPIEAAFTGRNLHQGTSPLAGKEGTQIYSELLSIWDDGLHKISPNSGPFDDEGVPCNKIQLLDKGVMTGGIWDVTSATEAGLRSTGNGFKLGRFFRTRPIEAMPTPGISTMVIGSGNQSAEELKKAYPEILMVESVMGAAQANNIAGDYSVNVSLGLLLKNGESSGRVKDVMISGNVHDLLKNIKGVSEERELCQIYLGTWEAPFILTAPQQVVSR